MDDSFGLHEQIAQYNWDDGYDRIRPIVENSDTEFATALMIYWRMDGPWFEGGPSEARRLHDIVEQRLLAGYYRKGKLKYDPVADNGLSKTQVYKLRKAGMSEELIQPKYGDA